MLNIIQIPVLSDNYIYLLQDQATGKVAVVDPALAEPVQKALAARGWQLSMILNTHHHGDHVGGNKILVQDTGCQVLGPKGEAESIPQIGVQLDDGDSVSLGASRAQVLAVPGHTRGHIAYWFKDDHALFCGDTVFSLGCGRLFEGTAEQMWQSLLKIMALPAQTRIYCAHEYTESNLRFALTVEPDNPALQAYAVEIRDKRSRLEPTIPSTLALELSANPFLRAGGAARFAELRAAKDQFR